MKIQWKFKTGAEPQGSSSGFWYDITKGGYIKPDKLLSDDEQLKKLKEAIDTVESFEEAMEEAGLFNEF